MPDTKVLQAILDGQVQIREDLKKLEVKVDEGFKGVNERFDKTDGRIDNLGMDLANLADDAPTVEEFGKLEKKVEKIGKQIASV